MSTSNSIVGFRTPGLTVAANALVLIPGQSVTASDTDYWTFDIGWGTSGGTPTTIVTITTKTGGSGGTGNLTGGTPYAITHSGFTITADGIGFVTATPTGTPETGQKLFVYPGT